MQRHLNGILSWPSIYKKPKQPPHGQRTPMEAQGSHKAPVESMLLKRDTFCHRHRLSVMDRNWRCGHRQQRWHGCWRRCERKHWCRFRSAHPPPSRAQWPPLAPRLTQSKAEPLRAQVALQTLASMPAQAHARQLALPAQQGSEQQLNLSMSLAVLALCRLPHSVGLSMLPDPHTSVTAQLHRKQQTSGKKAMAAVALKILAAPVAATAAMRQEPP